MKTVVDRVLIGEIRPYGPKGEVSAYRKREVPGRLNVDVLGLEGDQQADRKHHGGPDKAILHYAFDHYPSWRTEQAHLMEHLQSPGAFGENLSTTGPTETSVCLGDRFRLGTALVEVSQGRQPCWKLGHRFGSKEMVREVMQSARCGWYYRVVEPGRVGTGDTIELVDRPHPAWSVSRVVKLVLGTCRDAGALSGLSTLPALSENWRRRVQRRMTASSRR